jgi:hypothetical protein
MVHIVKHFKYLGAYISDTMKEDFEMQTRISKAWSVLGTHQSQSQSLLYIGGLVNALLWGAESWNLFKQNLNKLSAFYHSVKRWILGNNMERVKNEKIKLCQH